MYAELGLRCFGGSQVYEIPTACRHTLTLFRRFALKTDQSWFLTDAGTYDLIL